MGLAKEGRIIDFSNSDDPIAQEIKKGQQEIINEYGLAEGKNIRFVWNPAVVKPNRDNPGKVDKPRSTNIQLREVVSTKTDSQGKVLLTGGDWRYYETVTPVEDGKRGIDFRPESKPFEGILVLGEKNIDLIYFLLKFSSKVVGSDNESKVKQRYLAVENLAKEAMLKVSSIQRKSFIEFKISNDEQAGGLSEKDLRMFAQSIYVKDVQDQDVNTIRMLIVRMLNSDRNGYEKLKAFIDKGDNVLEDALMGIRVLVQTAMDKEHIKLRIRGPIKSWIYLNKDGSDGDLICNVAPKGQKDPHKYFVEYLNRKDDDLKLLQGVVNP